MKLPPGNGRYNFVFVMPDSMRAESIGCYGHGVVKTPNMDELALEGTLLKIAIPNSPCVLRQDAAC